MSLSFCQRPPAKDQRGTPAADQVGLTALYREEEAHHEKWGYLNKMTSEKTYGIWASAGGFGGGAVPRSRAVLWIDCCQEVGVIFRLET